MNVSPSLNTFSVLLLSQHLFKCIYRLLFLYNRTYYAQNVIQFHGVQCKHEYQMWSVTTIFECEPHTKTFEIEIKKNIRNERKKKEEEENVKR